MRNDQINDQFRSKFFLVSLLGCVMNDNKLGEGEGKAADDASIEGTLLKRKQTSRLRENDAIYRSVGIE